MRASAVFLVLGSLQACGGGALELPRPRPIVVHSGARIRTDRARMTKVNEWVTREQKNIVEDPTFLVETVPQDADFYPWDGMEIKGDTVRINLSRVAGDAQLVYEIYGHLHLMVAMGRQAEWLPEAPHARGFDLERAIVDRVADAWILGRTVFGTAPYGPLDEIAYARESGYLDAMIFTARPEEFKDARATWLKAHPNGIEEYRKWFVKTFDHEPPGLRPPRPGKSPG